MVVGQLPYFSDTHNTGTSTLGTWRPIVFNVLRLMNNDKMRNSVLKIQNFKKGNFRK